MDKPISETTSPPPARKLGTIEVAAISLGFMGPVMAMSLNGIGVAELVGKAVPFTFIVASIGTLFVAYSFIRLLGKITHAGSVYALAGIALGPRAGFFSGFALLGTYIFLTACIAGACATFFEALLLEFNLELTSRAWTLIPIIVGIFATLITLRESKIAAKITLAIGFVGILAMFVLAITIVYQTGVSASSVPGNLDFTTLLPGENSWKAIATASVFAFISWAGFESGSALSEEADAPKTVIPRALLLAVLFGGLLYVFIMFAQTVGYGTTESGITSFATASSTLTSLSSEYIGSWYAILIAIIAFIVAFGAFLSSTTATSRLLFALARDGFAPKAFQQQHPKTAVPVYAVLATVGFTITMTVILGLFSVSAVDTYYWYATIGVLCMIIAYGMASVGAVKFICVPKNGIPRWEIVFPVIALVYLGFVYIVQVTGQNSPYTYFPWIAGAWCIGGYLIALANPKKAKALGRKLITTS